VDGMRRVLDELVHEQQLVENLERTDFRADDEPGTSKSEKYWEIGRSMLLNQDIDLLATLPEEEEKDQARLKLGYTYATLPKFMDKSANEIKKRKYEELFVRGNEEALNSINWEDIASKLVRLKISTYIYLCVILLCFKLDFFFLDCKIEEAKGSR